MFEELHYSNSNLTHTLKCKEGEGGTFWLSLAKLDEVQSRCGDMLIMQCCNSINLLRFSVRKQ